MCIRDRHKVTLNLGYYNSSPSPALLCPCGVGEAHVATASLNIGYWICTLNTKTCGKLSPHQLLWVDKLNTPTVTVGDDHKCLTKSELPNLIYKLDVHAHKWKDIGLHLGFQENELDNIQARALLLQGSPQSWLRAMLSEWLQWAPKDSRGSSSFATVQALKCAVSESGLGACALSL